MPGPKSPARQAEPLPHQQQLQPILPGLTAGTYVFRLTVTDNGGATATNDVQIIVNSATNQAPTANAGPDQTITLPTSSVTLTGSGTDPDGTIASYAWTKVSGPAGGTIATPATASTNITGLTAGTYVFRLTVTDNGGATATNDVQIIVNSAPLPPPNQAPTANAGPDQTITLPTSSVTLTGSGTDPDGTIASYALDQGLRTCRRNDCLTCDSFYQYYRTDCRYICFPPNRN